MSKINLDFFKPTLCSSTKDLLGIWSWSLLLTIEPDLKRASSLHSRGHDFYLDWTNPEGKLQHHIKIETQALKATRMEKQNKGSYENALHSNSKIPFLMNFQQLKPKCADVFLWIAVYRDTIKYWVLNANAVQHSKYFTPQHRNEETALRENDYDKAEIYEGQIMLTNQNVTDFAEFVTVGKTLKTKIIEQYKLQKRLQ